MIQAPQNESETSCHNSGLNTTTPLENDGYCEQLQDELHIEIFSEVERTCENVNMQSSASKFLSSAYELQMNREGVNEIVCSVCTKVFFTYKQLSHHFRHFHGVPIPKECFICSGLFISESFLLEHLSGCHKVHSPAHMCEVCFKQFGSESELVAHKPVHPLLFACNCCPEKFPSSYHLNNHEIQHENSLDFLECHICGCRFNTSHVLQLHTLRHGRAVCSICEFNAFSQEQIGMVDPEVILVRHLKSAHKAGALLSFLQALRKQDEEEQRLDTYLSCGGSVNEPCAGFKNMQQGIEEGRNTLECGTDGSDQNELLEGHTCKLCAEVLPLYSSLKKHCAEKHPLHKLCPVCGSIFETEEQLSRHSGVHSKEQSETKRISPCDDQTSANLTDLKCGECSEQLQSRAQLMKHILNHQKPYQCDICYENFTHRREYKKHMRVHGVEAHLSPIKYKCSQCPVRCSSLSSLRIHLMTHTNVKPYLCEICGSTFRRPRALKVHVRSVHHASALHCCPQCGSTTRSEASLLRHVQCVHHGVRRFMCGLCGARCLQNQDLRRHLKLAHSVEVPPIIGTEKKSVNEIHVIPPIEALDPNDPLVRILKESVEEEKRKISSENYEMETEHVLSSDLSSSEPLNLLGNVASKAAPLKHVDYQASLKVGEVIDSHTIAPVTNGTKFFCSVCQITLDDINSLAIHLSMHQNDRNPVSSIENIGNIGSISLLPPPVKDSFLLYSYQPVYCNMIQDEAQPSGPLPAPTSGGGGAAAAAAADTTFPSEPFLIPADLLSTTAPVAIPITIPISNSLGVTEYSKEAASVSNVEACVLPNDCLTSNIIPKLSVDQNLGQVHLSNNILELKSKAFDFVTNQPNMHGELKAVVSSDTLHVKTARLAETVDRTANVCNGSEEVSDPSLCEGATPEIPLTVPILNNVHKTGTSSEEHIVILPLETNVLGNHSGLPAVTVSVESEQLLLTSSDSWSKCANSVGGTQQVSCDKEEEDFHFWENQDQVSGSHGLLNATTLKFPQTVEAPNTMPTVSSEGRKSSGPDYSKSVPSVPEFGNSQAEQNDVCSKSDSASVHLEQSELARKVCKECGKQFSSSYNLQRHMKVHLGEKSHQCRQCGKQFRYKFNLTVHMRSHTGERPFICNICSRQFRYLREYKDHCQSHEGKKLYQCGDCEKSFVRQRELSRHTLLHQSNVRAQCPVCNKTFSRIDYLKIHIKVHSNLLKSDSVLKILPADNSSNLRHVRDTSFSNEAHLKDHLKSHSHTEAEADLICTHCVGHPCSTLQTPCQECCCQIKSERTEVDSQKSCSSSETVQGHSVGDSLIKFAYEAAEGGMELVFVDKINGLITTNQQTDNSSGNVIYIEVLERHPSL